MERTYSQKKIDYAQKLNNLLEEYPKILIVFCDNVGSNQMQLIRAHLRGKAVVLMGKNTQIRRVLHNHPNKDFAALANKVRSNVGFVFTKGNIKEIKDSIESFKVDAPAKAGVFAPNDVVVPAGPTGMEPTQTSFLQALFIQSKIVRGQIEILSDVNLIKKGDKVQPSQAALLAKLNIRPFQYGMESRFVYEDGQIYDTKILEFTDAQLFAKMATGIANVAAISIAASYPTVAMIPFSIARAFKNLLAISFATEYSFDLAEKMKNSAATAAVAAPAAAAAKAEAKEEEKEEEEEEEGDMGLDLFG
jgi:large subunit ribosomal protein LP0